MIRPRLLSLALHLTPPALPLYPSQAECLVCFPTHHTLPCLGAYVVLFVLSATHLCLMNLLLLLFSR